MIPFRPPASDRGQRHRSELRRLSRLGYGGLAAFVCTLGLWSATTTISGAVVAPGQFVVESSAKRVQHALGGIAAEILVREGDDVAQGQVLVRLDDTTTRTSLQIVAGQIDELLARRARLEAERDDARVPVFDSELLARSEQPDVARAIAGARRAFEARAMARTGQRAQIRSRVAQLENEISGLDRQRAAKLREHEVLQRELEGVRKLYARNLVQINRLSLLEREETAIEGQIGLLAAQMDQARGKIAEAQLQLSQIDEDLRVETSRELYEVQSRLAELKERRLAALDQFQRVEIRSPVAGKVHQLAVHGPGAVVTAAEPLMTIVPSGDALHLEARVAPQDYDQLHLGQQVLVRVSAFNQRTTPELVGDIGRLAPDVTRDTSTGERYYLVRVRVPSSELAKLAPDRIAAGMVAEAFIRTTDRSPASFLMKPLSDQFSRALRER